MDGMKSIADVLNGVMNVDNSQQGDFVNDDGLLICGKCFTPKQYEIEMLGRLRKVPVMCDCRKVEVEAEEKRIEVMQLQIKIDGLRRNGLTDSAYLKWRFENDDRTNAVLSDAAKNYAEKWDAMKTDNIGLLFYGGVGTGKTFFAACIANALIERGVSVLMTNMSMLISGMQNGKGFEDGKTAIINRISHVPLLIIDDLGVERDTPYAYEKIQEVIDARYRSGKPLIVTTNLSPREMAEPTDIRYKRVFDRLHEMCKPVKVAGASRRIDKAKTMWSKADKLLGL